MPPFPNNGGISLYCRFIFVKIAAIALKNRPVSVIIYE